MIPRNPVDGHVVGIVSVEECTRVSLGTDMQFALFRADEVHVIFFPMEIECRAAACVRTFSQVTCNS
jgi:hypothetical protein